MAEHHEIAYDDFDSPASEYICIYIHMHIDRWIDR